MSKFVVVETRRPNTGFLQSPLFVPARFVRGKLVEVGITPFHSYRAAENEADRLNRARGIPNG